MAEPIQRGKSWSGLVFSHTDAKGKKIYKRITAPTKREWKQKEAEFIANQRGLTSNDMTVGECVEQYITSKEGVLSPSTIRGYRTDQNQLEPLNQIMISRLDSATLQYFVSDLAKRRAPKSVKNIYSLLTSAVAVIDDRRFRVTLPAKVPVVYNTPDNDQVQMLMDTADREMKLCIVLSACGTLRRGEICGLDYEDVLYDFNAVFVHRVVVKCPDGSWADKEVPKTSGSMRRVILPKAVIEMIGTGEGRIYPHPPDYITHRFTRLRNSVGLKCRFHDLRHYAASVMHAIGVPDKYIMERGGWTDDRVLKAVYQNTLEDRVAKFTKQTNSYFDDNLKFG